MTPQGGARAAARNAVDVVKRVGGDAAETGRGIGLRRRFAALAETLGATVYRQRDGEAGLEPEIDRLIEEMRQVVARLDAMDGVDPD
ncbi:MAG: hypothetical protein R2878_03840 [Thermoleophilia bacterium]